MKTNRSVFSDKTGNAFLKHCCTVFKKISFFQNKLSYSQIPLDLLFRLRKKLLLDYCRSSGQHYIVLMATKTQFAKQAWATSMINRRQDVTLYMSMDGCLRYSLVRNETSLWIARRWTCKDVLICGIAKLLLFYEKKTNQITISDSDFRYVRMNSGWKPYAGRTGLCIQRNGSPR